jgi:hypothetical protein
VASAQPDVVLVMGRLAAQALLQSSEPFGKLRGQVHGLHGAQTVVTYDATYLLRNPADKAKAWDDLCLAMSLVQARSGLIFLVRLFQRRAAGRQHRGNRHHHQHHRGPVLPVQHFAQAQRA